MVYLGQDVDHIPGLGGPAPSRDGHGMVVYGPPDALAVVYHRMGGKAPGPKQRPPRKASPLLEKARPYQRDGVAAVVSGLEEGGGYILADDMGLGKTMQTLAVWDSLNRPWPLLVVAPASVRRGWRREFRQWLNMEVKLVETGAQAEKVTQEDGVVITSYELVSKLPAAFVPHAMVIDEAHLLRGRRAKRSEVLYERSKLCKYRLALSGTPMWGRPRDLWMLLKILFPKYRFGNANQFDYAYCGAFVNKWGGKENKGATRSDELRLRLGYVMTRRTKAELKDQLPSLTRVVRWLPGTKAATQALQAVALKQTRLTDAIEATLQSKIDPVVDAVTELEGRAIVFTWQKKDVAELARRITDEGFECVPITGDLTHAQREAAVDLAIKQKACVVATIDSSGTGVDKLQHVASTVLFHALDYTPIKMAQAESRAHRLGQTDPVTAVFFAMENSADSFIVETVVDKLDAWRQTMGSDTTAAMNDVMSAPQTVEAEERALAEIYARMGTDAGEETDE